MSLPAQFEVDSNASVNELAVQANLFRASDSAVAVVVKFDQPLNIEAPNAAIAGKPQNAKRDARLHGPAIVHHTGSNFPYLIPVRVPDAVIDLCVLLGSEWVDGKNIGPAVIVKRVQRNTDDVVF